jgi:hypothetical protein
MNFDKELLNALGVGNFKIDAQRMTAAAFTRAKAQSPFGERTTDEMVYMVLSLGGEKLLESVYNALARRHVGLELLKQIPEHERTKDMREAATRWAAEIKAEDEYIAKHYAANQPKVDLTAAQNTCRDYSVTPNAIPEELNAKLEQMKALGLDTYVVEDTPEGRDKFIDSCANRETDLAVAYEVAKTLGVEKVTSAGNGYDLTGKNRKMIVAYVEGCGFGAKYFDRKEPVA